MSGYISIRNWERFQHYKDRDPPWVKLYRDLLSSEPWVLGTDTSRLVQVAIILIAARYSNQIPLRWGLIIKVCCLDMSEQQLREAVEVLQSLDFLELHNTQDDSAVASTLSNTAEHNASGALATCTSEADQIRSDQIRSESKNGDASKTLAVSRETPPDWFLDFKLTYPTRSGDPNWRGALRAAHARIAEGHQVSEFLAGAGRYAEFVKNTGKEGTEFVQQASRFLGPDKPFLLPWNSPPNKSEQRLSSNLAAAEEFLRRSGVQAA